jgi:hypothetical protein
MLESDVLESDVLLSAGHDEASRCTRSFALVVAAVAANNDECS